MEGSCKVTCIRQSEIHLYREELLLMKKEINYMLH